MEKFNYDKEIKLDIFLKIILFLVNPFFGLVYSFKRIKTISTFIIFYFFCLLFGASFIISNNGLDSFEYLKVFDEVKLYSNSEFVNQFNLFLEGNKYLPDFYIEIISFLSSKISYNYHLLYLILSFVFSFFMINSLKFFILSKEFKASSIICLILLYLFSYNQIFNINGARFWTATWITIYVILNLFLKKNYKSLFYLILLPIIHSSGFINILLIFFIYLLRNKYNIAFILLLLSFIFSSLFTDFSKLFIDYLPTALQHKLIGYTDVVSIENRLAQTSAIKLIFNKIQFFYVNIFVFILIKNKLKLKYDTVLLVVAILLLSFSNFTSGIPSLGNRYIQFVYPLIALIWLKNRYILIKYNFFILLFPFCFALSIWEMLNLYLKVLEELFFVSPPFYTIYYYLL